MQTVKQACTPRPGTFDPSRRDTVLHLGDLVADRIDPATFFAENYITEGMRTLLTEGFRRLEGNSTQGVFKLTQAMGGGKTHNLLALGLLAKHPQHRADVMGDFYTPDAALGAVRVVAFSGRESDAPFGLQLDGERIEQAVEHLRGLLGEAGEGEVEVCAKRIHYASGQRFLDHMAELRIEHGRDEVEP